MVLILGTGVFEVFRVIKLNDEFVEMNKKNVELCKEIEKLNEEIKCRDKEIEKYQKSLKAKESKIGELEEAIKGYEEKLREFESKSVPKIDTSKKSYMDYRSISRSSKQGGIVYGDEAWTDEDGLRRWGEYYCVALGSYYGNVGDIFLIETSKGNKYKIIKADEKADKHTDPSNRYTVSNGCMMEWIVETNKLSTYVRRSGNINNVEKVSGNIIKIIKIKGGN